MMKKILLPVFGAALITVGALIALNLDRTEAAMKKGSGSNYIQQDEDTPQPLPEATLNQFTEYETVAEQLELSKYSTRIEKDLPKERIMIMKDANGEDRYKTIFVKQQSRLKIVDLRGGLVFNELIGEAVQPTSTIPSKTEQTPEYIELSQSVNLSDYRAEVVEDNTHKRITLYKDANGHPQYKTILVKKTGMVKVIQM